MSGSPAETGTSDQRSKAEALLRGHFHMLRAYLRHLVDTPQEADDVAQEVCLIVLDEPNTLLRGSDPGSYLRGMARHLVSRRYRRIRRDIAIEEVMCLLWEEAGPESDRELEDRALSRCLEDLHERGRRLIALRYRQGLSMAEIADRVGSTNEAVRMALVRVRQGLARCVEQKLEGGFRA